MAHEGNKLKQLIKSRGLGAIDLARAAAISTQAVYEWFKEERFGERAWVNISKGLAALEIPPSLIGHQSEAADGTSYATPSAATMDTGRLISQVLNLEIDELAILKEILAAPESVRQHVQVSVEAVLERHRLKTGVQVEAEGYRYVDDDEDDEVSDPPRTSRPSLK